MEIEWQDPPKIKAGPKNQMERIVAELQKSPGNWARVRSNMKTASGPGRWKSQGCESVARAVEGVEGRWDVYARWPLPEAESSPTPEPVAKMGIIPEDVFKRRAAPEPVTAMEREPAPVAGSKVSEAASKARYPETTHLDPDDPNDQYLARQRAQLEADRKARQAKAERQRNGVRR